MITPHHITPHMIVELNVMIVVRNLAQLMAVIIIVVVTILINKDFLKILSVIAIWPFSSCFSQVNNEMTNGVIKLHGNPSSLSLMKIIFQKILPL